MGYLKDGKWVEGPNPEDASLAPGMGGKEYGAPDLSKDDFIDADGNPHSLDYVVNKLKSKFPGSDEGQIRALVEKEMPKFQKVAEEEKGFLGEKRGFAEEEAELAKKKAGDVYGLGTRAAERSKEAGLGKLQAGAGAVGGQMRGAYGGGSMGMRGAIGAQQTMAKGAEQTYGAYGDEMTRLGQQKGYADTSYDLSMRKAEFGERTGLYGLEKEAYGAYESQLGEFVGAEQFKMRQGGRVPDKETFLEVLTKLPDAGGS